MKIIKMAGCVNSW